MMKELRIYIGDSIFNKWCWDNWTATCKRMKLDYYLTLYITLTKFIKDLNVRPETLKLLEENIGSKLLDISLGNDFLDLTQKAKATKAKITKVELHQTKKVLHSKKTCQQNEKATSTGWEKTFANHVKGLIYKELI